MSGNIGGVPAMPNLDSSSVSKLALDESKLQAAYLRVEDLISQNPRACRQLIMHLDSSSFPLGGRKTNRTILI